MRLLFKVLNELRSGMFLDEVVCVCVVSCCGSEVLSMIVVAESSRCRKTLRTLGVPSSPCRTVDLALLLLRCSAWSTGCCGSLRE
jgi:hypothetical protein